MAMHVIPFKGCNYSGSVNQNLLWRDGKIFLMDNHRAALWCWQQEINLYDESHGILHIDRHTDCLGANLDLHLQAIPDLRGLSIDDYLNAQVNLHGQNNPLFRWDNYLSLHIASFKANLISLRSVDHRDGDDPDYFGVIRPRPDELPENALYWLKSSCVPWIINIDLDYFFFDRSNGETENQSEWLPLFSEEYINTVFEQIKHALDADLVKAVTICLTPSNFTPGWQKCLALSNKIFGILGAEHPDL